MAVAAAAAVAEDEDEDEDAKVVLDSLLGLAMS